MTTKELREKYLDKVIIYKDGNDPMNKKKYILIPTELDDPDSVIRLANSIFRTKKENLSIIDGYINKKLNKLYLKKPFFKFNKINMFIQIKTTYLIG